MIGMFRATKLSFLCANITFLSKPILRSRKVQVETTTVYNVVHAKYRKKGAIKRSGWFS